MDCVFDVACFGGKCLPFSGCAIVKIVLFSSYVKLMGVRKCL